MYLVLPTNDILNNVISPEMEPAIERSQRAFDPKHAKDIAAYITTNPGEYVLGALTYAVDQEGAFAPVEDGADIGMLTLPLNAKLRSVDGQHRRHGIKEAIDLNAAIGGDHTGLLIYVEPDVSKRKQMFSDMNWTARVVSKSVNVGFDSRDPFARAVNFIVASHPLLNGRIETERAWITKGSNNLFTLGTVYDVLRRLVVGPTGRVSTKSSLLHDVDQLVSQGMEFFTLLQTTRPELQRVLDQPNLTEELRKSSILINGTTLKVLAGAICTAVRHGSPLGNLKKPLEEMDFSPSAELWRKSGFVPPGKSTPVARNQEVRAATLAVQNILAPSVTSANQTTVRQSSRGPRQSPREEDNGADLRYAVRDILLLEGKPMAVAQIRAALEERGVKIPGKGTDANIVVHLRRDPTTFLRKGRAAFALAAQSSQQSA